MKFFVVSDIHGFYNELIKAVSSAGFDKNNKNHTLIICGDLFDRGKQAKELLDYLLSLERLIIIRGNHEDLLEDCLKQLKEKVNISQHHWYNKTIDTIEQISEINKYNLICNLYKYKDIEKSFEKYFALIKKAVNYYEVGDCIFVHGWIPHVRNYEDLAKCTNDEWSNARWVNGMEEWHNGWKLDNKTIICGHWHTSFGNYHYHNKGSAEFSEDADFGLFKDNGIIALDGCIAHTKKVNVLIIEE